MKTIINLYIDAEAKELAKSKGINISRLFNELLGYEIRKDTKKDELTELKLINAKLASEIIELNQKLKKEEKNNKVILRK